MSIARTLSALVLALVTFAEPPPDPKAEFPVKLEALHKKTAAAHVQLAQWCASKKIHEHAWREYRRAVALEPGNAAAQKAMGRKEEGEKWVEDAKAAVKKRNEGMPDTWKAAAEEYVKKRGAMEVKSAKDYEVLAAWAAKAGLEGEAKGVWRELVRGYDGEHEKGWAALGYAKDGEAWVSPRDQEARKAAAKKVAEAEEGKAVDEQSDVERSLGWAMSKRKSAHFFLEAKSVNAAQVRELVRVAEAARAEQMTALGITDEDAPEEIHGIFGGTHDDFKAYVDVMPGLTPEQRRENKGYAQLPWWDTDPGWIATGGPGEMEFLRDSICHNTAHFTNRRAVGQAALPAWLQEGVAWRTSDIFNKSAQSFCMNLGTGDSSRDLKNPLKWRVALLDALRDGVDPLMSDVMTSTFNALSGLKAVKCWSVADWMISAHGDAFRLFLSDLRNSVALQESIFARFNVESWSALNDLWAAWIEATY